jgi:hypothetical protein
MPRIDLRLILAYPRIFSETCTGRGGKWRMDLHEAVADQTRGFFESIDTVRLKHRTIFNDAVSKGCMLPRRTVFWICFERLLWGWDGGPWLAFWDSHAWSVIIERGQSHLWKVLTACSSAFSFSVEALRFLRPYEASDLRIHAPLEDG